MFSHIARYSRFFLAILVLAHFVACSGGRRTTVAGTGSEFSGEGDFGDVTGGTGTGTVSNDPSTSSLFDSDLTSEESGTSTTNSNLNPTVQDQEQACLTMSQYTGGNNNGGGNGWFANNNTNLFDSYETSFGNVSSACFQDSFNSSMSTNQLSSFQSLFDNGIAESYEDIDSCVSLVMAHAPRPTDSEQVVARAFDKGIKAYVRCIRKTLRTQQTMLPWAQPQQEMFQYNDNNLIQLLLLLAQP